VAENYFFPFGQILKKVEQKDIAPKKLFVLGVYASAVHAKWIDSNGQQKVAALAVASEPEIFWRGENAEAIISQILIPEALGKLSLPDNQKLNGPSGSALDDIYLHPLGVKRNETWLSDLLPESRVNVPQKNAIKKHYTNEIIKKFNLPESNIPEFKKSELNSSTRREEILKELETSQAEHLILLGDLPIYWFLRFHNNRYSKLSDFGESSGKYGNGHEIKINNKLYNVIPLVHPRQANKLGRSNPKWEKLHKEWVQKIKVHKLI